MSVLSNNTLAGSSGQGGAGGYAIERSLRLNRDDSAYLNKNFSSDGNRKTFTYSLWVKKPSSGASETGVLLEARVTGTPSSDSDAFSFRFNNSDKIQVADWGNFYITTSRVFRDPSAWYHLVLAVDTTQASNNIKLYVNGELDSQGTYTQNTDTRVNAGSSTTHEIGARTYGSDNYYLDSYLADIHFIDGQALSASDFGELNDSNVWQPKKFAGTYGTNGFHLDFSDNSSNAALGTDSSGNSNTWTVNNLFASTGSVPTAPAANTYNDNTMGFYLNGNPPLFLCKDPTGQNIALNVNHGANSGVTWAVDDVLQWAVDQDNGKLWIGRNNTWYSGNPSTATNASMHNWASGNLYLGLMYDSTTLKLEVATTAAYTPPTGYTYWSASSTGSWVGSGTSISNVATDIFNTPLPSTGKVYLEAKIKGGVDTNSCLGLINVGETTFETDALRDSPVNGDSANDTGAGGEISGNYATWNPLFGKNQSLSNGNLKAESNTTAYAIIASTLAMKSGKWYMEYTYTFSSSEYITWGISQTNRDGSQGSGVTDTAEDKGFKAWDTGFYSQSAGSTIYNYSSSVSSGDIISLAFDADAGKLWVAKNGTYMTNASGAGNPTAGTNPDYSGLNYSGGYYFMAGPYNTNGSTLEANFGQRPFAYTAPSGYKCLNTANLPDPTIADGSKYFDVDLYNSTAQTQVRNGFNLSPDLLWFKQRNGSASHHLFDSVRGATERLLSNGTNSEYALSDALSSFDSTGYTLGPDTSSGAVNNLSGGTFVTWMWDAGSSTVTNTDGSISAQVRANPSAGFSIVSYAGTQTSAGNGTIGHGLNAQPALVISKDRDNATPWIVQNTSLGDNEYLILNTTDLIRNSSSDGAGSLPKPTSSVFYGSWLSGLNTNGADFVAYCFAPVEGYSAMGSYTGNGSADGPFVFLGFKPAFLLVKNTASGLQWPMFDSTRFDYNGPNNPTVYANSSGAETADTDNYGDFLSNGFKPRGTNGNWNASGATYIYYAVAEHPFKTSRAR